MTAKIPKHWKIKKLGEIGVFFKGKGVPKNKITDTGFKCLTYGDLYTKYDFVIEGVKSFIDKETALISQEIRYGDICFAGSGETLEDIGKCATFIDDKIGYAGGDIIVFRTEQNPIVMSYLLNSDIAKKQKFSMGQGHSVVHIYSSQLEMLKLPIPPLEEQEKIAEILLSCDKAIRLTTQIITQLKQRNQGLAQQLLTGEKRVKGFENSVWKEVRLGEIGSTYNGLTSKSKEDFGEGKPYIPYLNIFSNHIVDSAAFELVKIGVDDKQNKVIYGDILFTISSETPDEVGMSSVMLSNIDELYLNSFCFGFRLYSFNNLLPQYACYLFRNKDFREEIIRLAQGSTRFNLSKSEFLKTRVFLPTLTEQNAIAQILDTAHQELKLYEQKLQLLQAQKKTLMQKLLTGEVLTIKK